MPFYPLPCFCCPGNTDYILYVKICSYFGACQDYNDAVGLEIAVTIDGVSGIGSTEYISNGNDKRVTIDTGLSLVYFEGDDPFVIEYVGSYPLEVLADAGGTGDGCSSTFEVVSFKVSETDNVDCLGTEEEEPL